MTYNRRGSSTGPVYDAGDNLEEELYMGRDIKVQEGENDASSVISHE